MYDDDRDALAAEYVLGTLSADEREQAEALLVIDPGFAEIVRVWERRLGELNVMVEAVEPPPDVWDKIRTDIGGSPRSDTKLESAFPAIGDAETGTASMPGISPETPPELAVEPVPDLLAEPAHDLDLSGPPRGLDDASVVAALALSLLPPDPPPEPAKAPPSEPAPSLAPPKIARSADIIYLAREARRWRGFTVAMSAIAALLALYVGVEQFAPGLMPPGRQSPTDVASQTKPPGSRLVAVLQQEPTAPAFLLTLDPQSRNITVRRVTSSPDAGRSYELWLIDKWSTPHSLGLVGADEFITRPIPANLDVDVMRGASYAVSLEPAGGSPNGVPTGPILFTGKMVESVPGSPS
jgi:anti-sigma-K factor RskA